MKNNTLYKSVYKIYPGAYVPLLKEEEARSALKFSPEEDSVLPPLKVSEFTDSFKPELAVPGIKREDFLVHSD